MMDMIDQINDILGINRYRMYRRNREGHIEEIGTQTISWKDVKTLKKIFPASIYVKERCQASTTDAT